MESGSVVVFLKKENREKGAVRMSMKKFFVVFALATMLIGCNTRDALLITGGALGGALLTKTLEDPPPRHHQQPPVVHSPPAYYPPPPQPIICHDYIDGEWRLTERGRRYWHKFRHPKEVEVPCR